MIAAGAAVPFTGRDIVLGGNNRTHLFRLGGPGGIILPLQPLCSIRLGRNWVTTGITGSAEAADQPLKGTQVKENMGIADALITFDGFFMSSAPTLLQSLGLPGYTGAEEDLHWADKLHRLKRLFEVEGALPIEDWAPAEEERLRLPLADAFSSNPDPFSGELKDLGRSLFEELGITHAVLLSFRISEVRGRDLKVYTLRLQQDRVRPYREIMPTETEDGGEWV